MYIYHIAVVLNLFRGTKPYKFHTCSHRTLHFPIRCHTPKSEMISLLAEIKAKDKALAFVLQF